MHSFEDDAGYPAWLERHQHGFVINTTRMPDPRYLMLHRASCHTIRGKPARGDRWTTGDFIKACSETRAALDQCAPDLRRRADTVPALSTRLIGFMRSIEPSLNASR